MKTNLTSAEKGLIWTAFIFGIMALVMAICPYIATYMYASRAKNPELGGMAFGMTFGIMMLAFSAFSWIASIITLIINAIWNRPALKTRIGISTVIIDIIVLGHAIYAAWKIF